MNYTATSTEELKQILRVQIEEQKSKDLEMIGKLRSLGFTIHNLELDAPYYLMQGQKDEIWIEMIRRYDGEIEYSSARYDGEDWDYDEDVISYDTKDKDEFLNHITKRSSQPL